MELFFRWFRPHVADVRIEFVATRDRVWIL
jgi:hypothetical protein